MSKKSQRELFDRLEEVSSNELPVSPDENPKGDPRSDADPSVAESAPPSEESPTEEGPETVYVVDGHALIYQVFHALPEMTSPSGEPVGAVHGFVRDMVEILENHRPTYLFVAFDPPGETFRHQQYEQYKADREEVPADLRPQIATTQRMLAAMDIPVLMLQGYEADDVLATVAREAEARNLMCFLVTGDKDCRQLITDRVKMLNIRKGQILDAEALMEDWGVRPDQVVDFQSLVGDKVDNVPGVPLIGPKIARELLEKYETLDNVLDHAEEVSGKKRRENLINGRESALLSRELVRLVDDVPIEIDWSAGRVGKLDPNRIQPLCQEFGFRSLAQRLDTLASPAPLVKQWQGDYQTIESEDDLRRLADTMSRQSRLAVDTETTSTNPRWAELVGYCFAWEPTVAYYVPVRAPAGDPQIDPDVAKQILQPLLENPAIKKIGQNLKYDMIVLRSAGIDLQGVEFDTMVADYLLHPGERSHSMDDMSRRLLDHEPISIKSLIGSGKKQKRMDEVPVSLVTPYAAEDADVSLRLASQLELMLAETKLKPLFDDVEMPLVAVLAELEFQGIRVDTERLKELGGRFADRMQQLKAEIYALAGGEFNIDSRQQLAKVLFEDLQLPVVKKTKSGPSTDADVLLQLSEQHDLPAKIVEYRQNAKLKSTYVDGLLELVHPQTGRVHTSFRQDVAATGRLSSTEPNLQNIPVRTEQGREIRSAFLPGVAGWRLMTADYSQIELRVLAHFCGDATLQQAFADDQDIHALVAAEVAGVRLEEVSRDMRRNAKAVNFGVIYGQSAFGLAKSLNIETEEAAAFIDAYFARYPGVDDFMKKTLAECRKAGYVKTILGRRRAVQGVRDPSTLGDSRQRILPERIAINTVIQGSAADIIKLAMLRIHRRLQHEEVSANMLLQIHDELIFEVVADDVDSLSTLVREEMTSAYKLNVPLKVDVKVGDNWAECEPWDG